MKYLYILTFIAFIKTPLGADKVYKNVSSWKSMGYSLELTLETGKKVIVPAMFTVIEEI